MSVWRWTASDLVNTSLTISNVMILGLWGGGGGGGGGATEVHILYPKNSKNSNFRICLPKKSLHF